MNKNGFNYGVVIDEQGYYVAALRWADGTPEPKINRKGAPKFRMLREDNAINNVAENGRWNDKKGDWDFPTKTYYVVNERGSIVSGKKQWPDRLKGIGPKEEYVTKAPPKKPNSRPIWDGKDWAWPRRVAIINTTTGEIEDIQLENPRDDQPNVEAAAGCICAVEADLPMNEAGEPVGIGHKLKKGEWEKAERKV